MSTGKKKEELEVCFNITEQVLFSNKIVHHLSKVRYLIHLLPFVKAISCYLEEIAFADFENTNVAQAQLAMNHFFSMQVL